LYFLSIGLAFAAQGRRNYAADEHKP